MDNDIITVGRPLPRIASIEALKGRMVSVTWRSGETKIVDLAPIIASKRALMSLRTDDDLFKTLSANEDGNAIEWADGTELSAVWVEQLVPAIFDNAEFRSAMDELHMSLDGMAAALEVSRRLIAEYRKDKPIPRHIALATRYLVEHQAHSRAA